MAANEIYPAWAQNEQIIPEDSSAAYIDGYVTLVDGTCIRLRGDGTGTDENGRDWTSVSREIEDDEFEYIGWALTR